MERKVPDLTCICECDNRIWGAEGPRSGPLPWATRPTSTSTTAYPRTATPWRLVRMGPLPGA